MNGIQRETIPNTVLTRNVRHSNQMNIIIKKFVSSFIRIYFIVPYNDTFFPQRTYRYLSIHLLRQDYLHNKNLISFLFFTIVIFLRL